MSKKNQKITILKGLAGSGKSTFAKDQVKKSQGQLKRVNKDDLRAMIDQGQWSQSNEKLILQMRDYLITSALDRGYDVIVDDTNLAPRNERDIRKLVAGRDITIEVVFFNTDLETCIERNSHREGLAFVPEKAIRRQAKDWTKWQHEDCTVFTPDFEVVEQDPSLPRAVQCDLDGTLAIIGDRSPYDGTQVDKDLLDSAVASVLMNYHKLGYKIILMSGREENCRELTELWLEYHHIPYDELHMRISGDQRRDAIIKNELFHKYVKDNYYIEFVLEDRNQVVDLWRKIGLKCFQVEYGNF